MLTPLDIHSDDPRLAVYRDLKRSNLTRWSGLFIAEGDKVVERLLASGLSLHSVLIGRRWLDRFADQVSRDIPLLVIDDADLPALVGFDFHRGVLACGHRPANPSLETILPHDKENWTIVVCPNVQGPDNLGNILRSCAALGVDAVLLGCQSADPYSRRVLRVSMGELLRLPLRQTADLASDLDELCDRYSVELVATVLDESAEPLEGFARAPRTALLLGGEGCGLDAATIARCQRHVTIAMARGVDSLNVATAAGIMLFELTRGAR